MQNSTRYAKPHVYFHRHHVRPCILSLREWCLIRPSLITASRLQISRKLRLCGALVCSGPETLDVVATGFNWP